MITINTPALFYKEAWCWLGFSSCWEKPEPNPAHRRAHAKLFCRAWVYGGRARRDLGWGICFFGSPHCWERHALPLPQHTKQLKICNLEREAERKWLNTTVKLPVFLSVGKTAYLWVYVCVRICSGHGGQHRLPQKESVLVFAWTRTNCWFIPGQELLSSCLS